MLSPHGLLYVHTHGRDIWCYVKGRWRRKTTEKTTHRVKTLPPFPQSPVLFHRPGQRGGGFHLLFGREGGLSHTHVLLRLSFPSSFGDRVYLFCGVASGRLGLTQQPSIRSCAHAGRETLLHRLLLTEKKSPVSFFFSFSSLTLSIGVLFVCFACRVKSTPCDARRKREKKTKKRIGTRKEEDNRVIFYPSHDQHYQRPIP